MIKKLSVKPFFTAKEMDTVKEDFSQDKNCLDCGLFRTANNPKQSVTGEGKLKIIIVGEVPDDTESELFLEEQLRGKGFNLRRDFWLVYALGCSSLKEPKRKEIKCCRGRYLEFIETNKPNFIWLMGKAAIESYFMDRFMDEGGTNSNPERWRALCVPDPYSKAWVIPMYNPSYALKKDNDTLALSQWDRDIEYAIKQLERKPPELFNPYDMITIITEFEKAKELLTSILHDPPKEFAFDYETTGLKPFNIGHKIASVAYCDDEEVAYAFPLQHPSFTKEQQKILCDLWADILSNDSKKIAHNLKYEDVWSQRILGAPINNWESCTMNAAHLLDNRGSFSGLKFQSFVRWGIDDYDKTTRQYLKADKDVEFNNVMKTPLESLLLYNGIDALLTLKLHHEQQKEMTPNQKKTNQFFKEGLVALADIQMNGIPANRQYYEQTDRNIAEILVTISEELKSSPEAKLFRDTMGKELSLTSDHDLRKLFFGMLKLESSKETDGGLKSVDAEVLNSLNSDFARKLVKYSKLDKVKGTYIGQFLREIDVDSMIRPFFDLHKADTGRGGCSRPNWQNVPTRDDEAKKYTRSGIIPSEGNCILGFDYKALEVSIAACISKDPTLMEYCADPSKDMHRDEAMILCKLKKENVSDKIRFYAKNGFVFPEIYGSYYRSCAKHLWEIFNKEHIETQDKTFVVDHMTNVGILKNATDYKGFEKHVKTVEEEFWERFKKLRSWQERSWKKYERTGVIELPTGFICKGYMSRNKIVNSPIQGSAFHCLLYSLIHIHKEINRREMKSKIIGQIHDNLVMDCVPSEKEELMEFATKIATDTICKDWKWIIVPLMVSWEGTEVNQSWYYQTKVKVKK